MMEVGSVASHRMLEPGRPLDTPSPAPVAESSRDGARRTKRKRQVEDGEESHGKGRRRKGDGEGKKRFPRAAWYFSQTFWSRTSLKARHHTLKRGDGIMRRCALCERGTCGRCTFRAYSRAGNKGGEPLTVRFCKYIASCDVAGIGATKRGFYSLHRGGLHHNGRNVTDFTNMLDARVIEFENRMQYHGMTYKLGPNFAAWQRGELWPDVGLSRNMILALPKGTKRREADIAFVEGWAAGGGDVSHEVYPFHVRRELFRAYWVMFRMEQAAGTTLAPDVRRRIAMLAAGANPARPGPSPDTAGRKDLLARERQRRQHLQAADPWQTEGARAGGGGAGKGN